MYMGIIARPNEEHNFDGKIDLIRVANTRQRAKKSHTERFVLDSVLNNELRNGIWQSLYVEGMMVEELCHVIVEEYMIDDDVGDRLTFWYDTFVGNSNNTAMKHIDDDECPENIEYRPTPSMEKVPLNIKQVKMKVR